MGESWRVKALAAITEDVPAVHNYLQLWFQGGFMSLFWPLQAPYRHVLCLHAYRQDIYIFKQNTNTFKFFTTFEISHVCGYMHACTFCFWVVWAASIVWMSIYYSMCGLQMLASILYVVFSFSCFFFFAKDFFSCVLFLWFFPCLYFWVCVEEKNTTKTKVKVSLHFLLKAQCLQVLCISIQCSLCSFSCVVWDHGQINSIACRNMFFSALIWR